MPGHPIYKAEIEHEGLNKYRLIKGSNRYVVEQMANAQLAQWDEMWKRKQEIEGKRLAREKVSLEKEQKKQFALERTEDARNIRRSLKKILLATLQVNDAIIWDSLKANAKFPFPEPKKPILNKLSERPSINMPCYQAKLSFWEFFTTSKKKKQEKMIQQFKKDCDAWVKKDNENKKASNDYHGKAEQWKKQKSEFEEKQRNSHEEIERSREAYTAKTPEGIIDYCNLVLTRSIYPDFFPKDFEIDYNENNKMMIIDYVMPNPDHIPTVKEVRYNQSRDEFTEPQITTAELNRLYDSVIYQISLRTIHELFESDAIDAISSITFNGWVKFTNKANGKKSTSCILSIQATKDEFNEIDLANIDPKTCFKALKGVSSSQLHSITAIAPIMSMNKEDARFIESYAVAENLDESVNLAAINWEDFEHLVRELFEKEFNATGGEVKVTRASRDGGVDAVAFDPDPIRGGKIVIQAKRYTNTVGVSAVRDLYGTVVNEGATKGILVSTSDYGPDAYEFAKGKPLALLNGSNLLHLLAKHGRRANIDLKEAKRILAQKEEK